MVINQFQRENKKEEDEAITVIMGCHMEDSNLTQLSYHTTVGEGTNNDIQAAPPKLKDGVQSTIYDLKKINLPTLEDPRSIFTSSFLTPEEERKYFTLYIEFKDFFG